METFCGGCTSQVHRISVSVPLRIVCTTTTRYLELGPRTRHHDEVVASLPSLMSVHATVVSLLGLLRSDQIVFRRRAGCRFL